MAECDTGRVKFVLKRCTYLFEGFRMSMCDQDEISRPGMNWERSTFPFLPGQFELPNRTHWLTVSRHGHVLPEHHEQYLVVRQSLPR